MANIQCIVFLLVCCCLVLRLSCYVINNDEKQYMESLFIDGKKNKTAAKKCIPRSNCLKTLTAEMCDKLNIVCDDYIDYGDSDLMAALDYEDSSRSTTNVYSYFNIDKDIAAETNVTFYPNDHTHRTYSHLSPSAWGYLIMIKIFIIVFLRIFCCNYRRRSIMFIPASSAGLTCHGISNPLASQQQENPTELSRCPLTAQHETPTVVVESSRQKNDSPPPPYPTVVSTDALPPPDYNTLFPKAQTSSSIPPPSS